jgi:hypothetical protein
MKTMTDSPPAERKSTTGLMIDWRVATAGPGRTVEPLMR